jgi:predicted CopG family antitoxin
MLKGVKMTKQNIAISQETKDELNKLKIHKRQSYEEIINELIKEKEEKKNKLI